MYLYETILNNNGNMVLNIQSWMQMHEDPVQAAYQEIRRAHPLIVMRMAQKLGVTINYVYDDVLRKEIYKTYIPLNLVGIPGYEREFRIIFGIMCTFINANPLLLNTEIGNRSSDQITMQVLKIIMEHGRNYRNA